MTNTVDTLVITLADYIDDHATPVNNPSFDKMYTIRKGNFMLHEILT